MLEVGFLEVEVFGNEDVLWWKVQFQFVWGLILFVEGWIRTKVEYLFGNVFNEVLLLINWFF